MSHQYATSKITPIWEAALIIWDEVPMQHKFCFEGVDRSLKDVTGKYSKMFGGIPTVFGDFAQILPVVKKGTRASTVSASFQSSYLWQNMKLLRVTENMRIRKGLKTSNLRSGLLGCPMTQHITA